MEKSCQQLSHSDYTVGWICALPRTELVAAAAMLDEEHPVLQAADPNDFNSYLLGRIGNHNVVIACLPAEQKGKVSAATVAKDMIRSFPAIRFGLMVGIGGGAPLYKSQDEDEIERNESENGSESAESEDADELRDIRLGDVVISAGVCSNWGPTEQAPGIVLNAISMLDGRHAWKGNRICEFMSKMLSENPAMEKKFSHPGSAKDILFLAAAPHIEGKTCESCRGLGDRNLVKRKKRSDTTPRIHYGTIGSADQVIMDAFLRDKWAKQEKIKCFEMEAAGLMDTLPCLVIRGICDYADSHKNKIWQPYAAAVAAAYAKELLLVISGQSVINLPPVEKFGENVIQRLESWRRSDEEEKCLQSFFTMDYEYQKNLNPERELGTCNWCLHNDTFLNWQSNDTSCLLWITADPGCGKSVLSKSLVDERLFGLESSDTTICYFFFKDVSPEARSPASAVAAFLHQILKAPRGSKAMRYALPPYRERAGKLSECFDAMWDIVKDIAKDPECGRIILVLDALDECEPTEQRKLVKKIKDLELSEQLCRLAHHLKIIVTSRPYWNIEAEFGDLIVNVPSIRLKGESLSDELHLEMNHVVRARVSRLGSQIASLTTGKELLEGLLAAENRTYLWLHLIFQRIAEMPRIDRRSVKSLLQCLPKNVDDVYNDILSKAKDQIQAKRLLQIIVAAVRPLSVQELGVALFFREDIQSYKDLELQTGEQLKTTVRNTCGLFIHIVNETVFLIHHSAKEFLLSPNNEASLIEKDWKFSISMSDSQLLLASVCIFFLRLKEFGRKKNIPQRHAHQLTTQYVFLDYSANNWAEHFRNMSAADQRKWFPLSFELFSVESESCMDWQIAFSPIEHDLRPNSLHLASYLGLEEAVRKLLVDYDVDINSVTLTGCTPLRLAVSAGQTEIVKLLLEVPDIDVNLRDGDSESPLWEAISMGHTEILKLLLRSPNIDSNKTSVWEDLAPLQFAIYAGWTELVELLLSSPSIDVDMGNPGNSSKLLCLAISEGHTKIVKLLLSAPNIEVNVISRWYEIPLWSAISGGNTEIVKLLLEAPDIDVNLTHMEGGLPLRLAISMRYSEAVKLLLEAPDIDVNLTNMEGESPLRLAISMRYSEAVKLLLEAPNIDVNLTNTDGESPLWLAIWRQDPEAVKLLLQAPGVDVNLIDGWHETPLILAISTGYTEATKLLLEAPDIDVNLTDMEGESPLRSAIRRHDPEAVKLLLEAPNIDVNLINENGESPLSLAISMGYTDTVKLLLSAPNIDVNLGDAKNGGSPLNLAIDEKYLTAVKLLLEAPNIDINLANRDGSLPLSFAIWTYYPEAVKFLLEVPDVNVNLIDKDGDAPLHLAIYTGITETVKLLLEAPDIDVNLINADGESPLISAIWKRDPEAVKLLLEAPHIDVNLTDEDGESPLKFAINMGYTEAVKLLLGAPNIDVNLGDAKNGESPLSLAIRKGYPEAVKLLLEASDINVNIEDDKGNVFLNFALCSGNAEVVKLLEEALDIEII
ncbi:hypothetical protein N7462_009962 [Penicillium macrosclerotiorum]|uniref:uncharacterized protein n=1 Tax=Penicillium macrosclerotiorum TaxID=303699 RepID=UPI002548AD0F|nr:uncharacterized protein N7462_009962 [Penicillium macrosclerotiorum]KAJ5668892.1 hypothetical protein N7462_009962 [Penicillium macrosclerotiorum]